MEVASLTKSNSKPSAHEWISASRSAYRSLIINVPYVLYYVLNNIPSIPPLYVLNNAPRALCCVWVAYINLCIPLVLAGPAAAGANGPIILTPMTLSGRANGPIILTLCPYDPIRSSSCRGSGRRSTKITQVSLTHRTQLCVGRCVRAVRVHAFRGINEAHSFLDQRGPLVPLRCHFRLCEFVVQFFFLRVYFVVVYLRFKAPFPSSSSRICW